MNLFYLLPYLLFSLFFNPSDSTAVEQKNKNVLIINSYHQEFEWSAGVYKGIIAKLQTIDNVEFYTEHMDTIRQGSNRDYLESYKNKLYTKYTKKGVMPDVIISIDDNAFEFLLKERNYLFKNTPIVFCGVNNFHSEQIKNQKNITGVNEETSFSETLALAFQLSEKPDKLAIIAGSRLAEQKNLDNLKKYLTSYKNKAEILFLSNMELADVINSASKLSNDDVVIYISYLESPSGKHYESDYVIKALSNSTDAKIFASHDNMIKFNVLGGKVVSSIAQGEAAGEMAAKILKGTKADEIPVLMKSPNAYVFNGQALQKHSISKSLLPKNSTIINLTPRQMMADWQKTVKESFFDYELFKNHGTIMLIIDPKTGTIMDANSAADIYYGYEELIGKKIQEINILTENEIKLEMQKAKEEKKNFFNFRHRLADGNIRDVEVYSYPIELKDLPLLFSIIFDVTEKLASERKIKDTQKYIVITLISIMLLLTSLTIFLIFHIYRKRQYEKKLIEKNMLLEKAQSEIKTLSGIIPICMHCKQIRDDLGYWNKLEDFISKHSQAMFSHGLCPHCAETIYKDILKE